MAIRREPVTLDFSDCSFVAGMRRASEATRALTARLAWLDATWEPHDWSDFD